MIIVSACLAGLNCIYKLEDKTNSKIVQLVREGKAIPLCPEQLGGLPTPRPASGNQGDSSEDVLDGKCKVLNENGDDVTDNFIRGAHEILRFVEKYKIKEFIGKQKSPSCGCGKVYVGTHPKKLIEGDGITTTLLKRNGIKVLSEDDI